MKLPDDPKERIKILALIGIGVVAVIIVLITFIIKPMMGRKTTYRADITKTKELLETAQRDVSRMMQDRDANTKVLEGIVDGAYHQNFILQPRLGNYELGAREFIEGVAQTAGVTIETAREIGITQMPQAAVPTAEQSLKCYNIRLTFNVGLHELIRFLEVAGEGNPYVCVSGVVITPRAEDPSRHTVNLDLQFPVWSDPTLGQQLEKRLEDAHAFVPGESVQS